MSVYWHVTGDASDVTEYGSRRLEMSNALPHLKKTTPV